MSVKKNGFQKICLILGLYIMTAVTLDYLIWDTNVFPEWMDPLNWNKVTEWIYMYTIIIIYWVGIFVPPPIMTFVLILLYCIAYPFGEIEESVKKSKFPIIYALMIIAFLIFYWIHWEKDLHIFVYLPKFTYPQCFF